MSDKARPSFLNYAPVALAFGTSGLRGLTRDITDLEAYINVRGALRYLFGMGDLRARSPVVLGGDLRPSTDRIMRACAQAIVDSDCTIQNAGKVPTPALMLHCISKGLPGVMVTGSHIPFDRNGIKVNRSIGEVLKSDEPGITREVALVRAQEYARSAQASIFDASGMLKEARPLEAIEDSARAGYVARYRAFPSDGLRGMRILVYQHSAVGRDILPEILRNLGAEVSLAGRSETFIPIDTENITDDALRLFEDFVIASEARGESLDAIVSTDGDSDRPLVLAVLSAAERATSGQKVKFLPGDLLGLVAAEYLGVEAAVVPISANDAVERRLTSRSVVFRNCKIGSPYVIAAIDGLRTQDKRRTIVGWEANGGFLVGTDLTLPSGTLPALPSRDSTLPILANLLAAAAAKADLSTLWSRLPARFGRAGLIDNFPVAVSRAIMSHLIPKDSAIEVSFDPGKAPTPAWQKSKELLAKFFGSAGGFDEIVKINTLDGVRVHFRNGDTAHLRPSGNAPQLRIYANSSSQKRADEIVAFALAEPNGIMRQLQKQFT